MKEIFKSFLMGVGAATGFFTAISFTADAELQAEAEQAIEYAGYLNGLRDGAAHATANKQCGWRDMFAVPNKGVM